MTSAPSGAIAEQPLSLAQRAAVSLAALSFVALTIWQVAAQRDDWPLSSFEMYSELQGPVATRSVVRGVSDQGEFELSGEMLPLGGARLRHLNGRLERNKARQRRFVALLQRRYEERQSAKGWPPLQGIRAYSEAWTIQPGLAGIDAPKRRATGALYIPPRGLLERLESERAGQAPPPTPEPVPPGDALVEAEAVHCGAGCELVADAYAAGGHALRLTGGERAATLSASVPLQRGKWSLFVRMRTPASGTDRARVTLDRQRLGGRAELGNYAAALGTGGWVWASLKPGDPALRFSVAEDGAHTLVLQVSRGSLDVDQLWLSRAHTELPIHNQPLAP